MKAINIYVIHAQWQRERERVIENLRTVTGKHTFVGVSTVNIRIVTEYDHTDINPKVIADTVNHSQIQDVPFYNNFIRNIHISQLSNTLKHYKALELIVNNASDDDINLVLENDVLFEDNMCVQLERLMQTPPPPILFLGFPGDKQKLGIPPSAQIGKEGFQIQNTKDIFQILPYCDSYLITKEAARTMYSNYLPIKFVNNIQMSYVLDKIKIEAKQAVPNIFLDGSKLGSFLSSINPSNELLFNVDYMKAKGLVEPGRILSSEDLGYLDAIWTRSPIKEHPDLKHLKALHLIKEKNYEAAKDVFASALKIYQSNNCIVNHDSKFLKDYIALFRLIQQ